MDEEIQTIRTDKLKPYHALVAVGDGLPALGIVAAVLGVVKAMGALDQSPEILGGLIGAALVGTFLGIFLSYAVVGPIATKIKIVREKRNRLYIIVKQTLLAYMNGSLPQVAIEFGRKTISSYDRPTIDAVEQSTMNAGRRRQEGGVTNDARHRCLRDAMSSPASPAEMRAYIIERLVGETGEPDRVIEAARALAERAIPADAGAAQRCARRRRSA